MSTAFSHASFRPESLEALKDVHVPQLSSLGLTPQVMFFGSSYLAPMSTIGQWQQSSPWPSTAMLDRRGLNGINRKRRAGSLKPLDRIASAFNASCHNDSVENMLYRFHGRTADQSDAQGQAKTLGLKDVLAKRSGEVKLWVVDLGTQLRYIPINGFSLALRELLLAIYNASCPGTLILLLGYHYRPGEYDEDVDDANDELEDIVEAIGQEIEVRDEMRAELNRRARIERNRQVSRPETAKTVQEDLERQDSGVSALHTANDGASFASTEVGDFLDAAKLRLEANAIARLRQNIDEFDWATQSRPVKLPRIEFLPPPMDLIVEGCDQEGNLNLEGYQTWMETLFPKVSEMLDRALTLQNVAKTAEKQRHQRLPTYAPKTRYGSICLPHQPVPRRERGWEHKGSNWLEINKATLYRLQEKLVKEGKLEVDGDDDDDDDDDDGGGVGQELQDSRRIILVDEMAQGVLSRTRSVGTNTGSLGGGDGNNSNDESDDSDKMETVLEAAMYMPRKDASDSDDSSPPRAFDATRITRMQRYRGKLMAFMRRFRRKRGGGKQR